MKIEVSIDGILIVALASAIGLVINLSLTGPTPLPEGMTVADPNATGRPVDARAARVGVVLFSSCSI